MSSGFNASVASRSYTGLQPASQNTKYGDKEKEPAMKLVTAIIQPFMIDRLARALFKAPISGYTVTESQGSAKPDMSNPQYLVPRSKVEIVIREEHVEELINIILHAVGTHQDGDGLLFVTNIDQVVDIASGKRGADALKISPE
ncbi:MAG: P-II family nitrogen regulator [Candidatus Melainabacteria bacterium]|nr:MAG: P-II family nitrogen regulator [Candidatus Melainabacteria bacterium]